MLKITHKTQIIYTIYNSIGEMIKFIYDADNSPYYLLNQIYIRLNRCSFIKN